MASTRAPAVAEVLWQLKKADKVAHFSAIANRAGFAAGANGRAMLTCLATIEKDWPHLQTWRAIRDDGTVEKTSVQARELASWGAAVTEESDGRLSVRIDEAQMMMWSDEEAAGPTGAAKPTVTQ